MLKPNNFKKKASKLLPIEDKGNLISYLSEHPSAADVIQGTGRIRKLSWAKGNKGKSGGFRVIYYFHNENMPLYLLAIFSKNENVNISTEEKHILSKAVKELVTYWRHRQ